MRLPFRLSLAVLLVAQVLAQDQVQIQFETDPVLARTGSEAVFTVLTVSQILSMTWKYQGTTLGLFSGGASTINPVAQFQGRITIEATRLRIAGTQLRDAGNYSVDVTPIATTGLNPATRSIRLSVFDAVTGLSLTVPNVAVETRNVSLRCAWSAGTEVTVQWSRLGAAIIPDSRISISGGSLDINPARRTDSGDYTCTARNPVSVQTQTRTLTIFYGPDSPVLTKDVPKECVGEGDVAAGQTARLTCTSASLPPALLAWRRDGQPVASSPPDSGLLNVQTFSPDESARYVCVATNQATGETAQRETLLTIVDTCLSVGEVVGIVIGSLLLLLIIILLIVLVVCLVRRRRRERERQRLGLRDTAFVQKNDPTPRPTPPEPRLNGSRDLGQGPQPPLYQSNVRTQQPGRLYTAPRGTRDSPQTLRMNNLNNSDTQQHNSRTQTNRLLQNSNQNANSVPHNGIDNPAFTHPEDTLRANTLPNTQQQTPNILIRSGNSQGGPQQPSVQVSLNPLPQNNQQNNNAQMPTINVNLNSYPNNGQQTQQDSSFPLPGTNNALQTQQDFMHAGQSNPRMQSELPYRSEDPRLNGVMEAGRRNDPGLIPTGYTHHNPNSAPQRNARTQTQPRELERHRRSDRDLDRGGRGSSTSPSQRQAPWDLLQGTPAYREERLPRGRRSPEYTSNTDYTTHPPIRDSRNPSRTQSRPRSQSRSRSRSQSRSPGRTLERRRTPPRRDPPSEDRHSRSRSDDRSSHTQRHPDTQREHTQRDIRGSPGSQSAPRHDATRGYNNPQAVHLIDSQRANVGAGTQQGPSPPRGPDTRALADPNHLAQAHVAQQQQQQQQQQRAAAVQNTPPGLDTQPHTQPPVTRHAASQPRQAGSAPVPFSAQNNPSQLTQAALSSHTKKAQTFQNRRQQTQAALLHPGPQARAPPAASGVPQPPIPPPVIPLAQFQTLPRKHRSPVRGPEPPRPPVNMPVAQRHRQEHQHHHHRPGQEHTHGGAHRHTNGHTHHGNAAHFTHTRQQQAHRERPR